MSIETISLILAANEAREVDVIGEYFELRAAVYDVAMIELSDRSGGVKARLSAPLESDFARPGLFEKIRVTNGATAQTVKFVYGTGDAGSRRNSGNVTVQGVVGVSGDVAIIDGEKARTIAGGMLAGAPFCGNAATKVSAVQLWNPAGSGKRLIVSNVGTYATTTQPVNIFTNTAALATDITATNAGNKQAGGAMGVGRVYADNTTFAAPPAFASNMLRSLYQPANDVRDWTPKGGVVLTPGRGLVVIGNTVNLALGANFEWFEETHP